ncbi:MAG: VOC family protein [Thermoplasmata archaeon]|nr:VOC family protein [Thermoplasmata archaeon]
MVKPLVGSDLNGHAKLVEERKPPRPARGSPAASFRWNRTADLLEIKHAPGFSLGADTVDGMGGGMGTMGPYSGGNVTLMVADVEQAIRFYEGVLELQIRARPSEDTVEFDGGGLTLRLHVRRPEIQDSGSGTAAVGLRVDDVDQMCERLRERSVRVGRILKSGDRRIALFGDPDGNHLYLYDEPGSRVRHGP